ncbi:MAG: UDP-N-acetyl-D-mannosamine dehydrogenase [Gammaproteobacteria bacterium]|nr:UDP-N-acetyl-D-mannosamine dehydrogenase [Gammaproteobacteria bacterium]MBQ0840685.1 UDP-N-acetyl-D-mannosamine dehydrogenase [Gammaproteobacteria bacterium]
MENTTVCVVGLGYIGLPTASLLGTRGFKVVGVDVSSDVVETINAGNIHIVEPDLDVLVKSAVGSGNLSASLEPVAADIFIIAVPTPLSGEQQPDLSFIRAAVAAISPYVVAGNLVVLESTSPVGTTDEIVAAMLAAAGHSVGRDVHIAYCPERVLPGRILIELVQNDRVVGGINDSSTAAALDFYQAFVNGDVYGTSAKTAEMVKLIENSYRDVNIAFANEISMIAEQEAINAWEVIELANRHPRVNILSPGPGVGGHCIAVDPWFLVSRNPPLARLISTARQVNDEKPRWVIEQVKARAERFKRPTIACLGLAFKADVDDLRESPAEDIASTLLDEDIGEIVVCEPYLTSHPRFELCSLEDAVNQADIVVLLVDHKAFRHLSAASLNHKVLIDTRGIVK